MCCPMHIQCCFLNEPQTFKSDSYLVCIQAPVALFLFQEKVPTKQFSTISCDKIICTVIRPHDLRIYSEVATYISRLQIASGCIKPWSHQQKLVPYATNLVAVYRTAHIADWSWTNETFVFPTISGLVFFCYIYWKDMNASYCIATTVYNAMVNNISHCLSLLKNKIKNMEYKIAKDWFLVIDITHGQLPTGQWGNRLHLWPHPDQRLQVTNSRTDVGLGLT